MKKNLKQLDYTNLVQIILSSLIHFGKTIDYLNSTKITRTACIWNFICEKFFGYYGFSEAMLIYQRWKRNSDDIQRKLEQLIKLTENDKDPLPDINRDTLNKLSFVINEDEWKNLLNTCSSKKMKIKQI